MSIWTKKATKRAAIEREINECGHRELQAEREAKRVRYSIKSVPIRYAMSDYDISKNVSHDYNPPRQGCISCRKKLGPDNTVFFLIEYNWLDGIRWVKSACSRECVVDTDEWILDVVKKRLRQKKYPEGKSISDIIRRMNWQESNRLFMYPHDTVIITLE